MDTQQPIAAPAHSRTPMKALLWLLVILVVGSAGVGGYFFSGGFSAMSDNGEKKQMSGLLIMATTPFTDQQVPSWIFPTLFDFGRNEFSYVPADKLAGSPDGLDLAYQHVFSMNGAFIAFVGAENVGNVSTLSDIPMQIYRADVSDAVTFNDFLQRVQNAERVTNSAGVVRQFPSVSNRGDVVYSSHALADNKTLLSAEANSWDIYLVSQGGEEQAVTKGVHPVWVDDTHFIFLKNDGLYLYDVAQAIEQKEWGSLEKASMRMSLDVSDDGQYIAWAAREAGSVFVLRALGWNGVQPLTLKGTIPDAGTYAVFSPDSRYLAVLAPALSSKTLGKWESSIDIFDIETLSRAGSELLLVGSEPNFTYLTDWRP